MNRTNPPESKCGRRPHCSGMSESDDRTCTDKHAGTDRSEAVSYLCRTAINEALWQGSYHPATLSRYPNDRVEERRCTAAVKACHRQGTAHKGYQIKSMATLQECPLCHMPQKSSSKLSQAVSVTASKLGGYSEKNDASSTPSVRLPASCVLVHRL